MYVPLLKSLPQLLARKNITDKDVDSHAASDVSQELYCSFQDGEHYKNNLFLSGEDLRISVCLYEHHARNTSFVLFTGL